MMHPIIKRLVIPLCIIGLVGCNTIKYDENINIDKPSNTKPSGISENSTGVSAERYLNSGNLEQYFYLLNTSEDRTVLLSKWEKQQLSLIELKLSQKKPLDAIFYLDNLKAIDWNLFLGKRKLIYSSLNENNYKELAKEYTDVEDKKNTNEFTIKSYNKLLAKVYLSTEYETEDGIKKIQKVAFNGSGVAITKNMILTNYHVIRSVFKDEILSYSIDVEINEKKYNRCEIISIDSINDLAVIKVNDNIPLPADYNFFNHLGSVTDLEIGTPIYVYSNHSGFTATLTKGIISATERHAFEAGTWIQIDAEATGGASGGLVLGENGLIYGIIIGGVRYDNINFAIPPATLKHNIEPLLEGISTNTPWLGLKLNETNKEVFIDYLFKTSVLRQYNIEQEARLFQINDKEIHSIEDAQNIITTLTSGNIVKLLIDNEIYYVSLRKRPETPFYASYYEKSTDYSYYPGFDFELNKEDITVRSILIEDEYESFKFYNVKRVKLDGYLYNNGVRKDDYLGIIDEDISTDSKTILLFHLPAGKAIKELLNVDDYIYEIKGSIYAESLL